MPLWKNTLGKLMTIGLLAAILTPHVAAAESTRVRMVPNQVFAQRADKILLADVYLPPGEGPFPAVLMIHGGAWAGGSRSHMASHALFLANHGYAVASISYRFAPHSTFPAQLEDCRAGLDWLVENAARFQIDSNRMAVWGYSAGGHLASLLATTEANDGDSSRFKAVVAGGAPCDFTGEPEESERLKFFLGGSRAEIPEVYAAASPVTHVTAKCPPMFFFHGTSDEIVPMGNSHVMHEKLSRLGIPSIYYKLEGLGHIGTFINLEARREALKFLDDHLKLDPS